MPIPLLISLFLLPHWGTSQSIELPLLSSSTNPWSDLLAVANMSEDTLKRYCPHFPLEELNKDFETAKSRWITKYPAEVVSFFSLPAIKALHPEPSQLGVSPFMLKDRTVAYHHYWVLYQKGKPKVLRKTCYHFPIPPKGIVTEERLMAYDEAINNWMMTYPDEFDQFLDLTYDYSSENQATGSQGKGTRILGDGGGDVEGEN